MIVFDMEGVRSGVDEKLFEGDRVADSDREAEGVCVGVGEGVREGLGV